MAGQAKGQLLVGQIPLVLIEASDASAHNDISTFYTCNLTITAAMLCIIINGVPPQTIATMTGKVMWCDVTHNRGSATPQPQSTTSLGRRPSTTSVSLTKHTLYAQWPPLLQLQCDDALIICPCSCNCHLLQHAPR